MAGTGDGNSEWEGKAGGEVGDEDKDEESVHIDVGELGVVEQLDAATMKCAATRCGLESAGSLAKDELERRDSARKLTRAVMICLFFMAVEVAGGLYANSLAILTDAAHLLTDVAGFALSLFAIWASGWEATPLQTFGFSRLEILGALGSILMIWLLTGILVYEAISRLVTHIDPIDGRVMFFVAAGGLVVNLAMMYMLGDEGHGHAHGHGHSHGHTHGHSHEHAHAHSQDDSHGHGDSRDHSHGRGHSRDRSALRGPSREYSPGRELSPDRIRGRGQSRDHSCARDQSRDCSRGRGQSRDCSCGREKTRDQSHGQGTRPRDQSRGRSREHSHGHGDDHGHSPRRERRHSQCGDRAESGRDFQHERGAPDDCHYGYGPCLCDGAAIRNHSHSKSSDLAEPLLRKSHSCSSSRDSSMKKPERNINVEGAYLHVLGDLIQSVGVMLGGAAIWFEPRWTVIDPICTLLFSVLVLWTTLSMIRSTLEVLMESTPREINAQAVERGLLSLPGVVEIHDLHIWAITVGKTLLSCHVRVQPNVNTNAALEAITNYCERRFKIAHVTIQVETDSS